VESTLQADCHGEAGVFASPDIPTTDTRTGLLMQSRGKDFELVTLFSLNDAPLPALDYKGDSVHFTFQDRNFVLEKGGVLIPLEN
jgi:hypothetical protein